jgi:hypothetical protein
MNVVKWCLLFLIFSVMWLLVSYSVFFYQGARYVYGNIPKDVFWGWPSSIFDSIATTILVVSSICIWKES